MLALIVHCIMRYDWIVQQWPFVRIFSDRGKCESKSELKFLSENVSEEIRNPNEVEMGLNSSL